jgi:hypothetical protein
MITGSVLYLDEFLARSATQAERRMCGSGRTEHAFFSFGPFFWFFVLPPSNADTHSHALWSGLFSCGGLRNEMSNSDGDQQPVSVIM